MAALSRFYVQGDSLPATFSLQPPAKIIIMKRTLLVCLNLSIGFLCIFFASYLQTQEVQVRIRGIRSANGNIVIKVFKDQQSYNRDQSYKVFTFDKKALDNGTLPLKLSLKPGIYGITLLDDENGNIDKNLIGMPYEGFGFSNFFMEKLKKPSFDDFKFQLKSNTEISIRVKYL